MNKGITITYNHLNLPTLVEWTDGSSIEWIYDANGTKLRKTVKDAEDEIITTKDYLGNVEYTNHSLEAIYHTEGRITPKAIDGNGAISDWQYEYTIKDHLGNGRVWWTWNETSNQPEVLQTADYYPFGMQHANPTATQIGLVNSYKYNGKELGSDFGLNYYHYGFRIYDPQIGRFPSIDPKANEFPHVSTYNYAENEPVGSIDLWGLQRLKVNGIELRSSPTQRQITNAMGRTVTKYPQTSREGLLNSLVTISTRISKIIPRTEEEDGDGGFGSQRNAFKHTLGSALLTRDYGSDVAEDMTNAHEGIAPTDVAEIDWTKPFEGSLKLVDNVVDFMNNEIGRNLVNQKVNEKKNSKEMSKVVLKEFRDNGLWVANEDDDGNIQIVVRKLGEEVFKQCMKDLKLLNRYGRK